MFYQKIVRAMTLLALLGCSNLVFAETCPPAGVVPANWSVAFGTLSQAPFQGAIYGMFNPYAMTCNYFVSSLPDGYVLSSNFNVQQPNPRKDPNWKSVVGFISCISKNIGTCQFTAQS